MSLWQSQSARRQAAIASIAERSRPEIDTSALDLSHLSARQLRTLAGFGEIAVQIPEKNATVFFGPRRRNNFDDRNQIIDAINANPSPTAHQVHVHGYPYAVGYTKPRIFRDRRKLAGPYLFSLAVRYFSGWQEGQKLTVASCDIGKFPFFTHSLAKYLKSTVCAPKKAFWYGRDDNGLPYMGVEKPRNTSFEFWRKNGRKT